MLARVLQVHDFAQTLKECDKQIKQLEIASTGKLRLKLGLDFGVSSDWHFKSRHVAAHDHPCLLQLSLEPQEMHCQGPYPMCIRQMPKVAHSRLFHKMSYVNKQPPQWVQQDHKALCESTTLLPSHRSMYVAFCLCCQNGVCSLQTMIPVAINQSDNRQIVTLQFCTNQHHRFASLMFSAQVEAAVLIIPSTAQDPPMIAMTNRPR